MTFFGPGKKATLVVVLLLVVLISSLKIPQGFVNMQRSATKLCIHIRADIPHISTGSDFQLSSHYHFCDQSLFHVIDLKLDIEPSLVYCRCCACTQHTAQWSAAARYAARWLVEQCDEYLCTGRAYRRHIVE